MVFVNACEDDCVSHGNGYVMQQMFYSAMKSVLEQDIHSSKYHY